MAATAHDVQRLFLQAILSRGVVTTVLAKTLWKKSIVAVKAANDNLDIYVSDDEDAWEDFIGQVNKSLDSLDMSFKRIQDEVSGLETYILINQKGDTVAQMVTDYTPAEIAYFKAIVEQIMLAPNETYCVSSLAALREVSHIKSSMSKTAAEDTLSSFVAKGWLLKSLNGLYSLSTRTLLELLPYLKETYPDEIIECTICMEILTRGVACSTANCKTRMHHHCLERFRRTRKACPSCTKMWPENGDGLLAVGEKAVAVGADAKRRIRINEDNEDEEEEPSQQQSQPSQKNKKSKSNGNGKGKGKSKRKDSSDEDEDEDEASYDEDEAPKKSQNGKRRR